MSRRLPPLNALRAFEAAARHLSFTRAAEELNVTQAAISHQVKALEERLGVRLFRRLNRALLLSEVGQAYLPPVRDALDTIAAATERLVAHDVSGTLNISVSPSVAAMWLVPRLAGFRKAHPEIDVRISADDRLTDFARDDVDLVIR
jgi:LysR family glycine cleavage system transcriptional activator